MLDRFRELIARHTPESGVTTYLGLRSFVFTVDPETIEVSRETHLRRAWCCLIDFGLAEGTATLVAIADGTVSLYTSTGGGVIGAGEHRAVAAVAERLLDEASDASVFMRPIDGVPATPAQGGIGLHVRTFDATLSAEVPEDVLRRGRHELAPLYIAGQDLLTEVRLLDEADQ